jgi:MoaA/NifB/PqqE/SkfB family radical SAM enzyme
LIIDQLKNIGCFYLGFTGGEPFMREDIIDILRYAQSAGFQVIVYTNGSLINRKIADQLAKLQLNKVDITICGMSEKAFSAVSGVSGARNKVFKAIDLLHKRKVPLGFKSCVLKTNQHEIKAIQKFCAKLNALHRLDDFLSRQLNGSDQPYQYRGKLFGKQLPQINCGKYAKTLVKRLINSEDLFFCGVGQSQAAITPLGELKPCMMINQPRYGILTSSLKQAWFRLIKFISAIKIDDWQCQNCSNQIYCKWCPAQSWLYNRTFISCPPESKVKTINSEY